MRSNPLMRALATASCAAALLLALAVPVHAESKQPVRLTLDDITAEAIDTAVEPPPAPPGIFQQLASGASERIAQYLADPETARQQFFERIGVEDPEALAFPALGVVGVLLTLLLLLSGRGDLIVSIEYPAELRGTFSVRLSRGKAEVRKRERTSSPSEAQRAKRKASSSSPTERHLISRETDFRDARSGRWTVTVDGFLQPQDDETVIVTHFEQREIRLRRGETVRLDFDFHPRQCPVDVRVNWDKRPASDALLAWHGQPHSLRYVRGGPVRMGATLGEHKLMVGSGDRVAELLVPVESFQPTNVEVDLADRDKLLFTGCPPAVEPYLHGDVPAAARALEREGQQEIANLLLGRLHAELDQGDTAARHFEQAGRTNEAAEIHANLGHHAEAGALFESAGDLARAAEMYLLANDPEKAGETFERARQFDRAVECYRDSNSFAKWVDALEKSGAPYEAAKVAIERGEWGRAIRSLQMVTHVDPEFGEAANTLLDAYQREGHLDLAARKVEEIIRAKGADAVPLETCDKLATALEDGDEMDRAVDMLEIIRRRDATYPNVATRIEMLRKQLHEKAHGGNSIPGAADFASGFRYEILEEVGRGGMGIVFKARDRRLGRLVALKRLPDDLRNHPKAISLFLGEARAAAVLNHPNIVTLFDAGQEGDTLYITMELLEGRPLAEILTQRGKLGARDVARIGVQIGFGLEYAHGERIIHRDIKTANLFFTKSKALKIMDFGLAKVQEEVRRASTVVGGTPYYMAPEQGLGEAVDGRADLYALGVTFFELLTGGVPFADGDVTYHHRHTPPPDPREKVPELSDEFAELLLQMLAKKPDDRPATAAEVVTRLQDIINSLSDIGS